MYFDSHAHLTEDCFAQDFDTIVENMKAASVTGMMEIGCDGPSSHHAVELAHQYDWIWAAVGSHPDGEPMRAPPLNRDERDAV